MDYDTLGHDILSNFVRMPWLVIAALVATILAWSAPTVLKDYWEHRRESRRIDHEIATAKARLDLELKAKRARIESREKGKP